MIKIFHLSDIHLDSPFSLCSAGEAEKRRMELRSAFSSAVLYAKEQGTQLCFIAGDNPFTHIQNRSITDGRCAIVIKDSFANCFVPYLTQNYSDIYVIDYRSYREMTLDGLIDTYGADDIIFVNAISVAQADVSTTNMMKVVG